MPRIGLRRTVVGMTAWHNVSMTAQRLPLLGWALFGVDAVTQVIAQAVAPTGAIAQITEYLLAPLLIVTIALSTRGGKDHLLRWTLLGLGLCFLGDFLPALVSQERKFQVIVLAYLLAQLAFCVAFWPLRDNSVLSGRPWLVPLYVAACVALVATCLRSAGGMWPLLVLYGFLLATMAVLASGLGVVGTLGGALFFLSDGLLALGEFRPDFTIPLPAMWIMATYSAALGLLTAGVLRTSRSQYRIG